MSKECVICGKRPMVGNQISHAHNVSKRRQMPNLQRIRIEVNGKAKRAYVCARCIKGGAVKKA